MGRVQFWDVSGPFFINVLTISNESLEALSQLLAEIERAQQQLFPQDEGHCFLSRNEVQTLTAACRILVW